VEKKYAESALLTEDAELEHFKEFAERYESLQEI